jgi:hypothetical protein
VIAGAVIAASAAACGTGAAAVAVALCAGVSGAQAFDDSKYPNWKGQWDRTVAPRWVPRDSKIPLTPEYRKIFEANLSEQAAGRQGMDPTYTCLSPGMPRIMNMYEPFEVVITPKTTHILTQHIQDARRIFTDGRSMPADIEPTFVGYSIGRWIDTDGDGRYDVLEIETRALKGPRTYDSTGIPFHSDNQTVVKESIYSDKDKPDTLYDEITVIDHALTEPWTVKKTYRRTAEARPAWRESICAENNNHIEIGGEGYMFSSDGFLMPTIKGQKPPDLRYFKTPAK